MWRTLSKLTVLAVIISATGCQSWSGLAFPMQNMNRVQPPGTGSYPVPQGYYSGPAAANYTPSQNQYAQQPVNNGFATSTVSSSGSGAMNRYNTSVQPAGFNSTSSAAQGSTVAPASFNATTPVNSSFPGTPAATQSLNDNSPTAPNLKWQG